jgi:hypothetical protein
MAPSLMLEVLLLGGVMGLLGQGARAVVGLKGMTDQANALALNPNDLFQAARLLTSLLIGFLVGVAAALIFMSQATGTELTIDWHILLGFAAAGYTGTDFLEGFISKYLAPTPQPSANALVFAKQSLLSANADEIAVAIPGNAKQFVYSVLRETLPTAKLTDNTKLSDLGYDTAALAALAARINAHNWHGVHVDTGAIQNCTKISDVTKVVAAAEK